MAVNSTSIDAEMLSVMRMSSTKLGKGMTSMTTTATTARGRASIPKVVVRGNARVKVASANGVPLSDGVTVYPGRSLTWRWPSWLVVPNGRVRAQSAFKRPSCGHRPRPAGPASAGTGRRAGAPRPGTGTRVPRLRSRRPRKSPCTGGFSTIGTPRSRATDRIASASSSSPLVTPRGPVLQAVVAQTDREVGGVDHYDVGPGDRGKDLHPREAPTPAAEGPAHFRVAFRLTHLAADLVLGHLHGVVELAALEGIVGHSQHQAPHRQCRGGDRRGRRRWW